MLHPRLLIVALVLCAIWLLMVFELVRRQKLSEGLSFIWVGGSVFLTLCVLFSKYFTLAAQWIGIRVPENAVLILGIGTLAAASLYLCTRISDLNRKLTRLTEETAILRKRQQMESKTNPQAREVKGT